jgi:hypothetical protein
MLIRSVMLLLDKAVLPFVLLADQLVVTFLDPATGTLL